MSVAAIVPMRHESERVPGKNYRELDGRPLYTYILDALRRCAEIDEIVVDTDSHVIRTGVEERYRDIRVLTRPETLRAGDIPMNDVLLHDLTLVEADVILQTHATNPLLRATTISAALRAFDQAAAEHDSLFSVTAVRKRFWSAAAAPVNHDPRLLLRTQDLPPLYEENSCVYVFPRETLERLGSRIGETPLLYEISALEAWDIDESSDWEVAECLLAKLPRVGS